MNIDKQLRAGLVTRWHLVPMLKEQTVSEHSHRVQLIAMDIMRILGVSAGAREILRYIAFHDLGELATGDIPTIAKHALSRSARTEITNLEVAMCPQSAVKPSSTLACHICKLADITESYIYLAQFGVPGSHKDEALNFMAEVYAKYLANARENYPILQNNVHVTNYHLRLMSRITND